MEGPLWRFLYSFRSNELTNMTATTNSISDWSIFKIFEYQFKLLNTSIVIWFIKLVGLAKHHHFNGHIWKSVSPITLLIDKCELEESTWKKILKPRTLSCLYQHSKNQKNQSEHVLAKLNKLQYIKRNYPCIDCLNIFQ
jgi:hypothetical protein